MKLGFTHFDRPGSDNFTCEVLTEGDNSKNVFRNKYVIIKENSKTEQKTFIGRIIQGPFFIPEEVDRESAIAQTSILKGDEFPLTPPFYALFRVEILGEFENEKILPSGTRPQPKSEVSDLEDKDVKKVANIDGNMLLGKLDGYNVLVNIKSDNKKVLPRNIGIFGTVGSGKSNSAQVIMEETLKNNYAVIVFDVEGEYVNMDKPSKELKEELGKFELKQEGVKNFAVYYPAPGDEPREDAEPFDVEYGDFDDYILLELIHPSEAQERAFSEIVEDIEKMKRGTGESKSSGPLSKKKKKEEEKFTLSKAIQYIWGKVESKDMNRSTGAALASKLAWINRFGIFDIAGGRPIDVEKLMVPGQLTVIDVSTVNDYVKNIVIVDILKKISDKKINDPKSYDIKTLILMEEAHTFISREARDKMEATMDMLKLIARRGRKRWLCLGFVSQQPSHLPNEIFELCNTRIIHSIKSESNLSTLKATVGGVRNEIWEMIPNLGAGEALIICPQFTHPLVVEMRPAKCERKFIT